MSSGDLPAVLQEGLHLLRALEDGNLQLCMGMYTSRLTNGQILQDRNSGPHLF